MSTEDEIAKIIESSSERDLIRRKAKWLPLYNKVILLDQKGWQDSAIATKLKIPPSDLPQLRKTPEYQERYKQLITETRLEITELVTKKKTEVEKAIDYLTGKVPWAIEKLTSLAESGDSSQRIQLDACKEILDRANVKSPDVQIVEHRQHTPEELKSMKQTLIEIESIRHRLIDHDSPFVRSINGTSQSSLTDESSHDSPSQADSP